MKPKATVVCLTVAATVLVFVNALLYTAEHLSNAYPSSVLRQDGSRASLAFILRPVVDLRSVFCDQRVVESRIRRGVCAVDFAFGEVPVEADVGKGMRLSRLLDALGKHRWRGGQRQIRVVSRNALSQSPLGEHPEDSEDNVRSFLRTTIMPGDMVVFTYIE